MAGTARALLLVGSALAAFTAGAPSSADPEAPPSNNAPPSASPEYKLDDIARALPPGTPFGCPKVDMVDYRGDTLKYTPAARVFTGFRDRLALFERVAAEVGVEVYGRPPTRVVNLGTYACRRMAAHARYLSEHGLGNAVDVAGFDFGALPRGAALPAGLDRAFKNGFEVRVDKHWAKPSGHAAVHARFLRTLARRLIARPDVFRVLLGPGYPGHNNHFHFDMAPFKLVQIFENGVVLHGEPPPRSP